MTRRDFCKYMALLTATAAALPEQIEAFTRLYDVNTRAFDGADDIIQVDDLFLAYRGITTTIATQIRFHLSREQIFPISLNAHGGVVRLIATPIAPWLGRISEIRWTVEASSEYPTAYKNADGESVDLTAIVRKSLTGYIHFIDMAGMIRTAEIDGQRLRLSEYLSPR